MLLDELQRALYTRLNAEITGVTGVYDTPPQSDDSGDDSAFPYIKIGPFIPAPWDTDGSNGITVLADISLASRTTGLTRRGIMGQIYSALHKYDLPITGANTVDCLFEAETDFEDPDNITHRNVATFRVTYVIT